MIAPKISEVRIGESSTFTCGNSRALWKPDMPYWFFNYKSKLPTNAIKNGRNLTIANIQRNNYGLYQCLGPRFSFFTNILQDELYFVATGELKVFGKFLKRSFN